jgi:DNA-binding beta-propeller fold protein YncE
MAREEVGEKKQEEISMPSPRQSQGKRAVQSGATSRTKDRPVATFGKPVRTAAAAPRKNKKNPAIQPITRKKTPQTIQDQNRNFIIFGSFLAIVFIVAIVGKIQQGPAIKLLKPEVLATFSSAGQSAGPMSSPRGLAIDQAGAVYVADLGNHRIIKFDANGNVAGNWGSKGSASDQYNEPSGLAVDANGDIFVADAWNGRIQKLNSQGQYLGEITAKAGNFYSPRNVMLGRDGKVYVADTGNSCVKRFATDGTFEKRWGEYGSGPERFRETFGLAMDAKQQVYVADAGNRRIKIFTSEGKYQREIRVKGWSRGAQWPTLAIDPQGLLYASDVANNQVWIYEAATGKYLGTWGNLGNLNAFGSPVGIAVDPQGDIVVSNMNLGNTIKIRALQAKR